jgi:hypothetical protein
MPGTVISQAVGCSVCRVGASVLFEDGSVGTDTHIINDKAEVVTIWWA